MSWDGVREPGRYVPSTPVQHGDEERGRVGLQAPPSTVLGWAAGLSASMDHGSVKCQTHQQSRPRSTRAPLPASRVPGEW
jgi:hypothetical protein